MPERKEQKMPEATPPHKRVVFTQGGKGGVGKTGFMIHLAEWFLANDIPFTLLDLDTENKSRGSLKHYFDGLARKINIHTEAGSTRSSIASPRAPLWYSPTWVPDQGRSR